jgi:hypothetical protein
MNDTAEAIKPDLRIFKDDETIHWREDIQARAGRIFGVYLFDANRHVHCCELTPSYELHYVGPTWSGGTAQDDDRESERLFDDIMEGSRDSEPVTYRHTYTVRAAGLESREMTDEEWSKLLANYDGDAEAAYEAALEGEMEYLRCNGWVY